MSFNNIVTKSIKVLSNLTVGENATLTILGGVSGTTPAPTLHVDTVNGVNAVDRGGSWANPLATMTYALSLVATGGKIKFRGDVREECIGSHLVFDVTIEGVGSLHHPDLPAAGYHPGSSCWRPPASPTAVTPLLTIRGRGWKLINILFDCPVDAAGVRLERNSSSGTSEYDASHASIIGCDFRNGLYGIQNYDGCFNVTIEDCVFETLDATTSAAAIVSTANTGVANPRRWRILNNFFQNDSSTEGNERHIVMPLVGSLIKGNTFGTVKGTGKYVDLTGGGGNTITQNALGGVYDTDDYVSASGDLWYENYVAVHATTAPDGRTLTVPGGP
jgi:hypothetical protein